MEYASHEIIKKDLEEYFGKIIKSRFKEYFDKSIEFDISVDYSTHRVIDDLMHADGFEMFGMRATMDDFQIYLNFNSEYQLIKKFPFSRLVLCLENDGNYHVFLTERAFEREWEIFIEDDFKSCFLMSKDELQVVADDIKKTHTMLMIKR